VNYFLFHLNYFYFLYNFGVCTIWQFLLLLRSLKVTQKSVQLCDGILRDFIVILNRVHF